MPRHNCGGKGLRFSGGWPICSVCDGRMHERGCTTRRNPSKDCCKRRHKSLHDRGQTVGINDSSVSMLANYEGLDD